MKSKALGVVVVRVQVPELHPGHRHLLDTVTMLHEDVLVVIGETEARLTVDDPLTYEMREVMIHTAYPNVRIARLSDSPSDVLWSEDLDGLIDSYRIHGVDPIAYLYGGRDSFLSHYHGIMRSFELPPVEPSSGTEIRAAVEPKDTPDFRAGMIYASKHKFPISYQCVDVAIWRPTEQGMLWLFGQKKQDNGKYRFVGGFVSPSDGSLEAAAMREVREETGVEPGDPVYIGSAQINDHRYPKDGVDRLMTAFFTCRIIFGAGVAADDLDACKWMTLDEAQFVIAPEHELLYHVLRRHIILGEHNEE